MKTIIAAINSKFIHSALAPWYLKAACNPEHGEICVVEHTVYENPDAVLSSINSKKPDIAAFSCYIWNITYILKLTANLKKILPGICIILGGPEVSYNSGEILGKYPFVDYVLAGEGEQSFPRLIASITHTVEPGLLCGNIAMEKGSASEFDSAGMDQIEGLAYRSGNGIITGKPAVIENLDSIASPYTEEMLGSLKNKIVYYEASRGCPFSCSYCLSSVSEGIRNFSLDRVFSELDRLAATGVKQIKFVDRTFNADKGRALAIIKHILGIKKDGFCNFHFEVGADLFDDEIMDLLGNSPKGLFQIEAGVQTANEITLTAICRKTNLTSLFSNLIRLRKYNTVHIHADLIAGLPYEDYNSFADSFNRIYAVKPHQLQLGFLKILKGTKLSRQSAELGIVFRDEPPYEVLLGSHIGFGELSILKAIAELVERLYNSNRFVFSLDYLIENGFLSAFDFYESFYYFQKGKGYLENQVGVKELYSIFNQFASIRLPVEKLPVSHELLRLDFRAADNTGALPDFMESRTTPVFHDQCFEFLRRTDKLSILIPEGAGIPPKQLFKKVQFDQFHLNILPTASEYPTAVIPEAETGGDSSQQSAEAGGDSSQQSRNSVSEGDELLKEGILFKAGGFYFRYNKKFRTAIIFNNISRDCVTGRYPFYCVNL